MKAFDYGVQLISNCVDSSVENIVVVNDSGEVVYEQVGDKESITVPDEVIPLLRGCHVFHNHPQTNNRSGRHLSNRDVFSMIATGSKSITSVARHKKRIVVTSMENVCGLERCHAYSAIFRFSALLGLTQNEFDSMRDDIMVKKCNETWRIFAKENNLKYRQYIRRTK
jgi:hypothetical protein